MNNQYYWNKIYSRAISKSNYDFWLDKYDNLLAQYKNGVFIDLGCGTGDDTIYLVNKGFNIIACDFSYKALRIVNSKNAHVHTILVDMLDGLPFPDSFASCIISDLSLHYFSEKETKRIVDDIKRVLTPSGILLCRVNSTADINFGALTGEKLDKNYFLVEGCKKRFFDEEYLMNLFKEMNIFFMKEYETFKYEKSKVVWEIALSK